MPKISLAVFAPARKKCPLVSRRRRFSVQRPLPPLPDPLDQERLARQIPRTPQTYSHQGASLCLLCSLNPLATSPISLSVAHDDAALLPSLFAASSRAPVLHPPNSFCSRCGSPQSCPVASRCASSKSLRRLDPPTHLSPEPLCTSAHAFQPYRPSSPSRRSFDLAVLIPPSRHCSLTARLALVRASRFSAESLSRDTSPHTRHCRRADRLAQSRDGLRISCPALFTAAICEPPAIPRPPDISRHISTDETKPKGMVERVQTAAKESRTTW